MNAISVYGSSKEIQEMATRFKTALRGGDKLANNEVVALAQIAQITGLNPFIGELWFIPGKGPMIGIAGARRLWNEKSSAGGGWSSVDIQPCSPQEAGAVETDVVAAFRAEAHDSAATSQYQKIFTETIKTMRESGSTDPFKDAKEICGPRPMWIGYGYSTKSETSRMNKMQLARKRAEADALKKCINVPFGAEVAAQDSAPSYIEAEATDVTPLEYPKQAPEVLTENINQDTGEISNAIELIDPMNSVWVAYAAEKWNIPTIEAAKAIGAKKLGKRMDKADFIALVNGA